MNFQISPNCFTTRIVLVAKCLAIPEIVDEGEVEAAVSSLYPSTLAAGEQVHVEAKGMEDTQEAVVTQQEERQEAEVGVVPVAQLLSRSTSTCMLSRMRSIKQLTIKA